MLNFNMNMSYTSPYGGGGGHQCPCSGGAGGFGQAGMNPMMGQQMLMFGMLAMTMMEMMKQMMGSVMNGGFPMPQMPGQFGQPGFGMPGFGGMPGGSPLGGFLGGGMPYGQMPYGGAPGGHGTHGAGHGSHSPGLPSASGPAGRVGNINVENLVNAIPSSLRPSARQHWPAIVAESQKQGITNKAQLAYILATTVHESGAGKHMKEFASGNAYNGRRDLGNTQPGDGPRFKGRGYVQITGRSNYTNWGRKLGINLVGNPALAERPEYAAKILVQGMKDGSFTGKKLGDYINGSRTDFNGARRIVNGTDKASTFASTARKILAAMG